MQIRRYVSYFFNIDAGNLDASLDYLYLYYKSWANWKKFIQVYVFPPLTRAPLVRPDPPKFASPNCSRTKKKELLGIVSTESLCFFTHPMLTHPRVPTWPGPVNHGYCFLSSFSFSKRQRQLRLLFPFFILFSRKEKLIGMIDGMTQK
jgi:hypothetical protein